ncbi:MAG: glycosyltransferase [Nanoarchaeota archaeon]|nr:glycosyltransferase [Nanoarchaeota archaeon]
MKLSVIIPVHNEEAIIGKTIKAIKRCPPSNKEIIIILNGCTDSTEKVAKWAGADVYSLKVANVSRARNTGAKKTKSNILVFNDADTVVSENYLAEVLKAVEEGYAYGCAKQIPETKNFWYGLIVKLANKASRKDRIFHGNCFMTKDMFRRSGGYHPDLKRYEDTDLAQRLKGKGMFKFITRAWIRPSERKFKKKGYFNSFVSFMIARINYMYFKKK